MARISGNYQSVTRGVSQQVPQDRRPGQHWEQINMISDPVRGVARRHGSVLMDEDVFANYTLAGFNATTQDLLGFKEHTFFSSGVEHSLIYRSATKVPSSLAPLAWCYNKDAGSFLPLVRPASDSLVDTLTSGGISAIVSVGRFLYLAGQSVTTAATTNNVWAATTNARKTAIWIRGGTYSRTFTVTCKMSDGSTKVFSYTTPSSSYSGTLSTSDIPYTATDYQKQVNDRTNAYNTAVTQWLGTASAAIQPQSIAENLRIAAAGQGITATRFGSTLAISDTAGITAIEVTDGGDGSFIRGVCADVAAPDQLTAMHYAGKIVRVLPRKTNEEDAYYLKAWPKVEGATGFVEVTWRECAGVEYTPTTVFAFATIKDGTFYVAGSASALGTLIGETVPGFETNAVGDAVTSPLPFMIGKKINYLGLFQDRLVIGSGSVLLFSRPGDYLNFFRASVLTIEDRDPVEMFAIGAEDDTITCSTTYDRSLVLFGRRKQYVVSGKSALTPLNQSVQVMSAHEDAADAYPVNSGNLVFFGKYRNNFSSLHQIQIGLVAESPEAFEVSQQLDTYLLGKPVEVKAVTAPSMVALRTTGQQHGFYIYTYRDTAAGAERLFDSWSTWKWNPAVGHLAGISAHDGNLLAFVVRSGRDKNGASKVWVAAERFSTDTALDDKPYLDSLRPYSTYATPADATWLHGTSDKLANVAAAYDNTTTAFMLGTPIALVSDLMAEYGNGAALWVGVRYDDTSFVTPTNPYVRDRDGKAILSGRLTLVSVLVSVADSGGFLASVEWNGTTKQALLFNGLVSGSATAVLGTRPLVTRSVQFLVAREVRECKYSIQALTWLPLTITALEWKGQNFNNARRG